MKISHIRFAMLSKCLVLSLYLYVPGISLAQQANTPTIASADDLFRAGKFSDAKKLYLLVEKQSANASAAAARLGQIALLENQLDTAQAWLQKVLAGHPDDQNAKIMLAEVFYRRNDFAKAGTLLSGIDPNSPALAPFSTLNAGKLESFRGQTPYELEGSGESIRLKFLKSSPLPIVNVRINGGPEVIFFIDTGGSELLLDTDFAKELGVKTLGSVLGTFSGGQHAPVGNGRIDSLTLGNWKIKNVPVGMLPLRSLSQGFGIAQLDGCIGTNVLYQFLSTLDYHAGELVLRRKTKPNLKQFEASLNSKSVSIPIWLQGDHFMLASGKLESLPPALFFVDSGLAGAAIKLDTGVIKQAGIQMDESKASSGEGGAGTFKVIPFTVKRFSLGTIERNNLAGVYDGPLRWADGWGFDVDGMVGDYFLKDYAVTFDFLSMRMVLQP